MRKGVEQAVPGPLAGKLGEMAEKEVKKEENMKKIGE